MPRQFHVVRADEKAQMPWLYPGEDLFHYGCFDLMSALCAEIRRKITTPGYESRSSLPRMRQELPLILMSSLDITGKTTRPIASSIFGSCDLDAIKLLDGHAPRTWLYPELWREISPFLTVDLLEEMVRQNLSFDGIPFPLEVTLPDHVVLPITRMIGRCGSCVPDLGTWFSAVRQETISVELAGIWLREALSHHPEEVLRHAMVSAVDHGDPINYMLCYMAGAPVSPFDPLKITNPRCRAILDLTRSNHGRMRIHAAIPSLESLFWDHTLLDKLY